MDTFKTTRDHGPTAEQCRELCRIRCPRFGLLACGRPAVTRMHTSTALAALLAMGAGIAHGAGGVPVVDPASIAQAGATIALEEKKDAALAEAAKKQDQKTSLEQRQLEAVDATLAAMTGLTDVSGLEGMSGAPAAEVYPIEDSNPHANRLFGDARVTIEQMIAETAAKYAGHPALARAGINPVEWRCWFQGLVKQESNFSIGARSSAAAFGLTQIIPGTAKYLGIYPDYYTDPRLQLDPLQIAKFKALIDQAKAQITKLTNIDNLLDEQTKKMIQQIALLKSQLDALRNGLTLADLGIDKNFLRDILPDTSDLTASIGAAKSGNWSSALTGGKVGSTPTGKVVDQIFKDSGMSRQQVTALAQSGDKGAQIIANQANTGLCGHFYINTR